MTIRSAPDKTGNVNKSIPPVIKRAQGNNGIVFNVKEKDLRFRIVIQKLTEVKDEDIPDINNPKTMKAVLEGDKLMKEVLNGGYNVHPVPPPNSEIKERITKRYERKRIKIEKLFTLGYTTSGDP